MLKMLRNCKGYAPLGVLFIYAITAGIIVNGVTSTAVDGTLKNNGKKIWCKMQNKGAQYCDERYQ